MDLVFQINFVSLTVPYGRYCQLVYFLIEANELKVIFFLIRDLFMKFKIIKKNLKLCKNKKKEPTK